MRNSQPRAVLSPRTVTRGRIRSCFYKLSWLFSKTPLSNSNSSLQLKHSKTQTLKHRIRMFRTRFSFWQTQATAALATDFHQFRKNTPLTFRGINAILALLSVWGAMPLNESEVEKCPTQYLKKRLNGLTKRSRTLSFCSFVFFCLKKLPPPSPFLPTKGLASMISRT